MNPINRTRLLFIEESGQYPYSVVPGERIDIVFVIAGAGRLEVGISVTLEGNGAACTVRGIVVPSRTSDIALTTRQTHAGPGATSDLLVKSVLSGVSDFVFDGHIAIAPGAQLSNAYQRNENLIIGQGAHAVSRPVLEILANDVRCTHGATVSRVSEDELWYLMSRGIPKGMATRLLVDGFLSDTFANIDGSAREEVSAYVAKRLAGNGILQDV